MNMIDVMPYTYDCDDQYFSTWGSSMPLTLKVQMSNWIGLLCHLSFDKKSYIIIDLDMDD